MLVIRSLRELLIHTERTLVNITYYYYIYFLPRKWQKSLWRWASQLCSSLTGMVLGAWWPGWFWWFSLWPGNIPVYVCNLKYSLLPQTLGVFAPPDHPSPGPTPTPWQPASASTAPWTWWPRETWRVRIPQWDHCQRGKQHCRDCRTLTTLWLGNILDTLGRSSSEQFLRTCYKPPHWRLKIINFDLSSSKRVGQS